MSSFACRAPISSGNGDAPPSTIASARSAPSAREALDQQVELVVDHRLEPLHQPGDVAGSEAGGLVPPRRAEAGDRLDDPHVGRRVAGLGRGQHAELGEPLERPRRDLEPPQDLLLRGALVLGAERPGDEHVAGVGERPQPLEVVAGRVEQLADHPQGHEPLLLELLDQPDPLGELGRVVGHVARGLHRLGQQALAQVVAHRGDRDVGALGQLGDSNQRSVASSASPPGAAGSAPGTAISP